MRLIACPDCHRQFDVTAVAAAAVVRRCGRKLSSEPPEAVEATVQRCSSCGALGHGEAMECLYCGSASVRLDQALSLICPECYARCAEDARFCTGCGVSFQPEAVELAGRELPCPTCSALMPASAIGGIGINECRGCHGIWVPGKHFERLVERALEAGQAAGRLEIAALAPRVSGANPAKQPIRYRKCPACDAFLLRRNYRNRSGIILDVCSDCGTWLDADETMSFLKKLRAELVDIGFDRPFKAEVYFVSTRQVTDLKWGTPNPVMLRDPDFGPMRVRAFGSYPLKAADPRTLLSELVGTDSPPAPTWHFAENGQTSAPMSGEQLARLIADGRVRGDTFVWTAGMAAWAHARSLPQLAAWFAEPPPPPR